MSPASLNGEGRGGGGGGGARERSCKEGGHAYKSREMRWSGGEGGEGENHSSIASAAEMLMLIV